MLDSFEECTELDCTGIDVVEPLELEVGGMYTTTGKDDVSTPSAVDGELRLGVCEELATLDELALFEDAWEGCMELLPDPGVLCPPGEVIVRDELATVVVAGPVTRQEQADEILEGESWH